MKTTLAFLLFATAAFAADPYTPTDADRARWTMSDMMTWRIALEAYATDHHVYPDAKTMEELRVAVQPIYVIHAPMQDAWGNAFRYERITTTSFRLVSAGTDGSFDESSWSTPDRKLPLTADAVVTNEGRWLTRAWDVATDEDRAIQAKYQMRVIRTAVEGYARVHNQWPAAHNMDELRALVQPDFIRMLPMVDPWGKPYIYQVDSGGYRVASASLPESK